MRLKLKRHYQLLILLVVIVVGLTLGLGDLRIVAYTVAGGQAIPQVKAAVYNNSIALFTDRVVHTIQISMDPDDYQTMVTTYQQTGIKDYFHANVVIDGVQVNDVGIRLKGNASLRQVLGGGGRGGGMQPPANGPGQPPANEPGGPPGNDRGQNQPGRPNPQAPGGFNSSNSGKSNTQIPLMIKFDEFVAGQLYQGYDRFAIRSAGISYDASMLQEPVTNVVLRLAGLPATETAYAGVSLNGKAEQLFTLSEVIEKDYLKKHFTHAGGVLYKAELQANLSYQGEDPSAYQRSFTQETRVNEADLAPLIKFLKFVSLSDDSTFENDLANYIDTDSFATYLAANNLLVNTDSMAGMGNNFYLYYDDSTRRFTVLMWDANESLGKLAVAGPGGRGGMGGNAASYDIYYQNVNSGGFGPGMRSGSNPLLTRFLANARFKVLYEQKLQKVYRQAFVSGAITRQIEQYSTLIHAASSQRSLVDASAYDQAVASVQNFIIQRAQYLASTPLLKGVAAATP